MTRARATATGGIAILLWATLATLSVRAAPVPPFLLNMLTFGTGALVGLVWMKASGVRPDFRALGWHVWVLGIGGLFGFHALYFTAMRNAPAAEASLICSSWPLLIVLLSTLLPGERLRALHVVGGFIGLAGAALLVGRNADFAGGHLLGYAAAGACSLTWAGYSVLSRRYGTAPTEAVTVFCAATALLSLPFHLWLEETAWPADAGGWIAVAILGAGPVGLAFYVWDIGVKKGDIQLLGVMSYAVPLLSTLLLIATGAADATWTLGVAALLIVGGAALAAVASSRS